MGLLAPVVLAGSALAGAPHRPSRLHGANGAESAGVAKTHVAESHMAETHTAKGLSKRSSAGLSGTASKGSTGTKAAEKHGAVAAAKGRRGRVEPVVGRAEFQHGSRAGLREVSRKSAKVDVAPVMAKPHVASAERVPDGVAKKGLTVDDFVRVAGPQTHAADGTAAPEKAERPASSEIVASGESHPDENEKLTVSDADAPKNAGGVQAPAPIVRAGSAVRVGSSVQAGSAGPVVPVARVSAVSRAASGTASLSGVKHDEAVLADDVASLEADAKPVVVNIYSKTGKLLMPAPLKGSHDILVHQNQMADDAGLTRIQDDADLDRMRANHLLVGFPEMPGLEVNDELPVNRRYARPWAVKFVTDTARAYYAKFHEPLRLNSAVRTVDYQVKLRRINGNAAAIDGEAASPHLTGQAIDFGKHGMSEPEIAWMRAYLLPLMQAGKVDVEEEFQQACFHISIYGSYVPKKAPRTEVAALHNGGQ